jgi:hypothetical protein
LVGFEFCSFVRWWGCVGPDIDIQSISFPA